MKIEDIWKCRVCGESYHTEKEAITCQTKHRPRFKKWATCEICGAAWAVGYPNPTAAQENARQCEKRHRDKGEVEEISVLAYFMSGGTRGKCIVKRGGAQ